MSNNLEHHILFEISGYTSDTLAEMSGVHNSTIVRWFMQSGKPIRKYQQHYDKAVKIMQKGPGRIQFHPSYGYATEAQIEKLKTLPLGPERDWILKEIERQTKNKGKIL